MWSCSISGSIGVFASGFLLTFLTLSISSLSSTKTEGSIFSEVHVSSTQVDPTSTFLCKTNNESMKNAPILQNESIKTPANNSFPPLHSQFIPSPIASNFNLQTRSPSIVLVVSAWNMKPEDIAWLETLPYPIVAYTETLRPKQNDHHRTEAGKYTHFMCAHYETLPDLVIFMHGHESGWHRNREVVDKIISEIDAVRSNPEMLLETFAFKAFSSDKLWVAGTQDGLNPILNYTWNTFLGKYFQKSSFLSYPDFMTGSNCCSELVVSSFRIRSRPRELWCDFLNFLNDDTPMGPANYFKMPDDKVKGMIFEWFVPFVFGTFK